MACTASSAPFCVNMFAKIAEGTMSHWVCGASATSIPVLASSTGSAAASVRAASAVKTGSVSVDASVIRQGGLPTGGAGGPGLNFATVTAQSSRSTAGAAVHTAGAVVGVVGGVVGVFAVLL